MEESVHWTPHAVVLFVIIQIQWLSSPLLLPPPLPSSPPLPTSLPSLPPCPPLHPPQVAMSLRCGTCWEGLDPLPPFQTTRRPSLACALMDISRDYYLVDSISGWWAVGDQSDLGGGQGTPVGGQLVLCGYTYTNVWHICTYVRMCVYSYTGGCGNGYQQWWECLGMFGGGGYNW